MSIVNDLKEKVLSGGPVQKEEAMLLLEQPVCELCSAADEIRTQFCGNKFDLCTIINGKSGRCSEDCRYCAQSAYYQAEIDEYPLLSTGEILKQARYNAERGILRYSIVTSGKRLSDEEIEKVCESIRAIKESVQIEVCGSFGLLKEEAFRKIKEAGASRIHCNLETSEKYFKKICTTHTYEEKIETLRAARRAGLFLCSGGIMGLGEAMEDRMDLAFTLRELSIKSVPVNFLNPIKGTPLEKTPPLTEEEKLRIITVYRFILPDSSIRLAGGRGLMPDQGESLFKGGANAAISGDMLTTAGITIETDRKLIQRLNYVINY